MLPKNADAQPQSRSRKAGCACRASAAIKRIEAQDSEIGQRGCEEERIEGLAKAPERVVQVQAHEGDEHEGRQHA